MSYHKVVKIWGVLLPVETCYTKISSWAREGDSYHILYSYGGEIQHWGLILHSTRNTHFIDELILLLGILKFIFRNGRRFHGDRSKQTVEEKGSVSTRRALTGVHRFLTLNLHSGSINLWQQTLWAHTSVSQ